ncbi:hypothetical protein FQN60_014499 [Etheostoma spectabile]|uniref:DEP domain-containing protein 7 n=1 Tax=Etheostoma spectabile TaxID=54343 RepID=A0A5J5DCG8_9PERO|nr:hypothetical protein FQN60_014499 [Etheostoma spectabile]
MASIKERAAALNLAEKLCVPPQAHGVASKPVQSHSVWSGLISHLRSSVTVKRRRVHLKSHNDCFLGSEAVDVVAEHISCVKVFEGANVSRDKVVCVCQALLDCNMFEAVGTNVFGKDKKQDVFQDSKSALYRFVDVSSPSVDELERSLLAKGIQRLFCSSLSDRHEEMACPTGVHAQMLTPVRCTQASIKSNQLDTPATANLSLEPLVDSPSPSRVQTDTVLPQSLVNEVWQEQTLLRLLHLVELPLLEGVLQCSQTPSPFPINLLAHSNPDLIYSSHHLDRQIIRAFRDSQEDEWICAALDCLDYLPDQPVVELSRELPHCFPQDQDSCEQSLRSMSTPVNDSDEQPPLSQRGLIQCKLMLYGTLVKHYSHADRPPLLPQHMTDIYTAITDLLVNAKLGIALEALQLCLKLLPSGCRDELCKLLTFMALAADPQGIQLDKEARIPGALHKRVSDKLATLVQGKQPDVTDFTFCQRVSSRTCADSTKKTTNEELWIMLNSIHLDTKRSAKEKKRLLGRFYQAHPEIFTQYFGDAVNVL